LVPERKWWTEGKQRGFIGGGAGVGEEEMDSPAEGVGDVVFLSTNRARAALITCIRCPSTMMVFLLSIETPPFCLRGDRAVSKVCGSKTRLQASAAYLPVHEVCLRKPLRHRCARFSMAPLLVHGFEILERGA
jgi:hypothetical protein